MCYVVYGYSIGHDRCIKHHIYYSDIQHTHIAMAEFLWKDPEEGYQIVTLPDGVQAPSASSAPTAAQWDLQRDERVLKMMTEQTAIATKIAEENKRFRAEEQMQKKGGGEPWEPGPKICPECGKNTWDLMTLGTCDACGMWKALWEEKKKKNKAKKTENSEETYDPGTRICPECKKNMGFADFGHLRCMWHAESC